MKVDALRTGVDEGTVIPVRWNRPEELAPASLQEAPGDQSGADGGCLRLHDGAERGNRWAGEGRRD